MGRVFGKRSESMHNYKLEPATTRNQELSARALRGLGGSSNAPRPMSAARSHHTDIDSHCSVLPYASRF